jgi:hypothetical protein
MELVIDEDKINSIIDRITHLIGFNKVDSEILLKASISGAIDQVVERIGGSLSVPGTMVSARAEELCFICQHASRVLNQREVEVIFRTTPAAARSILTMMRATYEQGLRIEFGKRMREDISVEESGSAAEGLTFTLRFSDSMSFEYALNELRKAGIMYIIDDPRKRTIIVDREAEVVGVGSRVNPLKILGL